MPGMDGTGPFGNGPFGRGLGPCGGGQGGFGRGRGFRRGGRAGWGSTNAPLPSDEEKSTLEQQKGWLENRLADINLRLRDLK